MMKSHGQFGVLPDNQGENRFSSRFSLPPESNPFGLSVPNQASSLEKIQLEPSTVARYFQAKIRKVSEANVFATEPDLNSPALRSDFSEYLPLINLMSVESFFGVLINDFAYLKNNLTLGELMKLMDESEVWEKIIQNKLSSLMSGRQEKDANPRAGQGVFLLIQRMLFETDDLDELNQFLSNFQSEALGFPGEQYLNNGDFLKGLEDILKKKFKLLFKTTYQRLFKEDPRNFVMKFLHSRVFLYDHELKKSFFNKEALTEIFDFFSNIGIRINGDELYGWLRMENQIILGLRGSVERDYVEDDTSRVYVGSSRFDVDKVYWGYFVPVMFQKNSASLAAVGKVREVDLLSLDPANMADSIKSAHHVERVKALADLYDRSPEEFIELVAKAIGYTQNSVRSNSLDIQGMKVVFGEYLAKVQEHIEQTIVGEALTFRLNHGNGQNDGRRGVDFDTSDKIHKYCKFIPELIGCRDLGLLVSWAAYPYRFKLYYFDSLINQNKTFKTFREQFDSKYEGGTGKEAWLERGEVSRRKYFERLTQALLEEFDENPYLIQDFERILFLYKGIAVVPEKVIRHQASVILQLFLFDEDILSSHEIDNQITDREELEAYVKSSLKIENEVEREISFRYLQRIDQHGNPIPEREEVIDKNGQKKIIENDTAEVVFDGEGLAEYRYDIRKDTVKKVMSETAAQVMIKGDLYRLYPVEKVILREVDLNFSYFVMEDGRMEKRQKKMRVLIYTGDHRIVHRKEEFSLLTSKLRGKVTSDLNRMALIFADENDEKAFLDFVYSRTVLGAIKIDHQGPGEGEKRFIKKQGQTAVSTSTTGSFKKLQNFAGAFYLKLSELQRGGVKKRGCVLEIMTSDLRGKLLGDLSRYSPSAHGKYRSTRAWAVLWNILFPPSVYGEEYARLKEMGYDYGFYEQYETPEG